MYELLAVLGIIFFIFAIIGIALYIVFAYSLYRMAVKQNLENAWLAWIPIAQYYTIGKLIRTLKVFDLEVPSIEIVLPVATIIVIVAKGVPVLGAVLSLANFVLVLFALNKVYKLYKPENSTLYTVLSILGITVPFIFLSIKELDQVSEISDNVNL